MICKKCGAQIDDGVESCPFCGAVYDENKPAETSEPVSDTADSSEAAEVAAQTADTAAEEDESLGVKNDDEETNRLFDENEMKRRRQIERMRAEKQSQLEEIERRRLEKKRRQKRRKIIIAAIIVILIAGIAAGSYYMINNGSDNGNGVDTVTQSPAPGSTEVPTPLATEPVQEPTAAPNGSTEAPVTTAPNWTPSGSGTAVQQGAGGGASGTGNKKGNTSTGAAPSGGTSGGSTVKKPSGSSSNTAKPSGSAGSGTAAPAGSSGGIKTSAAVFGGKEYNAKGGYSGGKFTNALITGVEVVSSGGRSYMAFKHNGTTYYANVNKTTTTGFVKGRPMTIDAYKTSENYNGNDVYEITEIENYSGTYIFPNSGFELLTEADLKGKTKKELRYGRNEIYARHGRRFKDAELRNYFAGCAWYKENPSYNSGNDESNLNSIEQANAAFISNYEKTH